LLAAESRRAVEASARAAVNSAEPAVRALCSSAARSNGVVAPVAAAARAKRKPGVAFERAVLAELVAARERFVVSSQSLQTEQFSKPVAVRLDDPRRPALLQIELHLDGIAERLRWTLRRYLVAQVLHSRVIAGLVDAHE
jgi:hypothetical protein